MYSANRDLIKAGKNALQVDIARNIFTDIINRSFDGKWDLTKLKNINFQNFDEEYMTFGAGVFVASDVENTKAKDKLVSDFASIFPTLNGTFTRQHLGVADDEVDRVNKNIKKFIAKNTPKICKKSPIKILVDSNDLSSAAIIFSFMILDFPWMYTGISNEQIIFRPIVQNDEEGNVRKNIDGFTIPYVKCGVGVFAPGIQLTRMKMRKVCKGAVSYLGPQKRLKDVWNEYNEDDYCDLSPEYAYLHIFHRVNNCNVESIKSDEQFDEENINCSLLTIPTTTNMTGESIFNLYKSVFETENIFEQSLELELPRKPVRFSMPNVELEANETIYEGNAEEYGIPKDCFRKVLGNLFWSDGNLNTVKCQSKLKINKDGVALSSVAFGCCTDSLEKIFEIVIDQPFCFAITVGNNILAKGVYTAIEK